MPNQRLQRPGSLEYYAALAETLIHRVPPLQKVRLSEETESLSLLPSPRVDMARRVSPRFRFGSTYSIFAISSNPLFLVYQP